MKDVNTSPATYNTISIHCDVLKVPDTFPAPTQQTFSFATVVPYSTKPLGEK